MPRPHHCRRIQAQPHVAVFEPAGVPSHALETVTMTLDEFEAVRLADREGLYQAQAAEQMGVSRPTFGRIIASARRKIADMLVHGHALAIEGGPVAADTHPGCRHGWADPAACPQCPDPTDHPTDSPQPPAAGPTRCGRRRRRCRRD